MMIKHLLWALYFLKLYNPEKVSAVACGVDEKTYRKWLWEVLEVLGELDLVRVDPSFRVDRSFLSSVVVVVDRSTLR